MKKVFALDQGEHIGGAEIFFSELLVKVSHLAEIHLFTGKNPEYLNRYQNSPVHIHHVDLKPIRLFSWSSLYSFFSARRQLQERLLVIKPNLILSNTVRTHLIVSPLSKKLNIPLIWMANDCTFPSWLLSFFLNYPMAIVSCSQFVQSYYQSRLFRLRDIHWDVLYPFGIENNAMTELQKIKKQKIIGMVGKFIPWKGHDLFIQMAKYIHQQCPEYRFVIIGSPYRGKPESEQFFSLCLNMIQSCGLSSVMHIQTNIADVLPELATWEILVHCSKTPEPLGRVILEGMAAGCAVIASNLGGPSEIVEHKKTGLLVPPNAEALSQATESLLSDASFRVQLQQNAIKNIRQHFLWPQVIEQFTTLLSRS